MLEKQIEKKVCDYAKEHNCLVYKFTSPQRASVPDRQFITDKGVHFFIEFKREGGKLTDGQAREIRRMRDHKAKVFVVDNVDVGKQIVGLMALGIDASEYTTSNRFT